MTPEELKKLQDDLQVAVKSLRDMGERADEERKRFGDSLGETKATIEKLNSRIDELETRMARPPVGGSEGASGGNKEQKAAFFKFMREGRTALTPEEKALVSDTTGQILIPEELESEIYRELPALAIMRGLCTVRPIATNRIRRRSLTEVEVGWGKLETGATLTESTPVPSEAWQYVEDLYGLTKIGEDELMDTDTALESIVYDSFSRAIAEAEDTAFIIGQGHDAEEPDGILTGSTVARVEAGQAGAVSADDFIKLAYAVPAQYRRNGAFVVSSATELAIRLLKDANDHHLWQPSLQLGRPSTFAGYPMYNQEDVPGIPAAGTAADVAIFGDFKSGYRILHRLGMTVQRLVELYAEDGLVGFKAHFRVGGSVIRPNALRILNVPSA